VTGPGSIWSNSVVSGGGYGMDIGYNTSGDSVIISNGGVFDSLNYSGYALANIVGTGSGAVSNSVTVTGSGSVWSNDNDVVVGAYSGSSYNSVSVVNSGKVFVATQSYGLIIGYSGSNNVVTVSGPGSVLEIAPDGTLGGLNLGWSGGQGNELIVSNGASVINHGVSGSGSVTIGYSSGANNNGILVTGAGSIFSNAGAIFVGSTGANSNSLTVNNGAKVVSTGLTVGSGNNNSALITSGGILEGNSLVIGSGSGNTISNVGGVIQFTTATPTITPNGSGNIALTGGTISFRAISNADVTNNLGNGALSGITFAGANTFQLNAASNTTAGQTYTFQTVAGDPSNYVNLAMVNGSTAYRGGNLTIGSTGSLFISNTTATVTGLFTNQGTALVTGATASFSNGIVNSGVLTLQAGTLGGNLTNLTGGLLQGNGTIRGSVTNFGTISPGFSVGSLTITGNLSLAGSSVVMMELSGYGAGVGTNNTLNVGQLFAYGGTLDVTNITGFAFAAGQSFQLFNFGSQGGDFAVTNLPDLTGSGLAWNTAQLDNTGALSIVVVPEPTAFALLAGAALALLGLRRRRVTAR
jgi:T5SS/PEP-CTERM-associated repeat protein